MATCEEFLKLYQLCQSAKRCMGEDCPDVSADCMEQAREIDQTKEHAPDT